MTSLLAPQPPTPPPVVDPGEPLSAHDTQRYARHISLPALNDVGQRRIGNARVLVVGAGGLGSPVLLYLAAAGVGTIGVIDDDTVEISNLQRQVLHTTGDVGRPKVTSAREAIHAINPGVRVVEHACRLTADNALQLLDAYDVVIDGADNFATRYLVSDATTLLGKPSVWGSLLRFDVQVSVFWSAHGPTYRDLYPEPPEPGSVPSCGDAGVLGMVGGIAGALMASEAIKIITGIGTPLIGRVARFDALHARWQEFRLAKDPQTPPITALDDYERLCGVTDPSHTVVDRITPHELEDLLRQRDAGSVAFELLDVRERWEHDATPLPGARLVPLVVLAQHPEFAGADKELPVIVHCEAGFRSDEAARILTAAGYTRVRSLSGGAAAWAARHVVSGT